MLAFTLFLLHTGVGCRVSAQNFLGPFFFFYRFFLFYFKAAILSWFLFPFHIYVDDTDPLLFFFSFLLLLLVVAILLCLLILEQPSFFRGQ